MNKVLLILVLALASQFIEAQELNCKVTVNLTTNTTSINRSIFKNMEQAISNFVNNKRWTDKVYNSNQKIDCSITINLTGTGANNVYTGDFIIQSTRPVFNSTYSTPIFRHSDKSVPFQYIENQPMDFSLTLFNNNLTSVLAFYCNMLIAMDLATFSNGGGKKYFDVCQTICATVPPNYSEGGQSVSGWNAADAQSLTGQMTRVGMVTDYLNSKYSDFMDVWYEYHINGVDLMADDPKKATTNIQNSIEKIEKMNNRNYIIRHFVLTKVDEIVNIFKNQPKDVKTKIGNILVRIEPTIADKVK